jgi:CelD/BcsL family acetyltransferase involved in cellulose biosynthesis
VPSGEWLDALTGAERIREEWDALAVSNARPFCSPAWMLAWWRHAAPEGALLRIIAVRQGNELLGIAPFYTEGEDGLVRYRLLGSEASSQAEPLARPGAEEVVARIVADALAGAAPRPDVLSLKGIGVDSPWPLLLKEAWRGRVSPSLYRTSTMPCPTLILRGRTYEDWFATIDPHVRRELRRRRRRLEERGAVFRLADSPEAAIEGLRNFAALHYARWNWRGGSGALDPPIERMLADAAERLVKERRIRLWSIEVDGKTISAQLFVGAGGELAYWLGGFDEAWGAYGPSIQAVRAAIEHAWESGDARINFGPGGQDYKYSFADGEEMLQSVEILPRTIRYPVTLLRLIPSRTRSKLLHLRHRAFSRLSRGTKQWVKGMLARFRKRR